MSLSSTLNLDTSVFTLADGLKTDKSVFTIADGIVQELLTEHFFFFADKSVFTIADGIVQELLTEHLYAGGKVHVFLQYIQSKNIYYTYIQKICFTTYVY